MILFDRCLESVVDATQKSQQRKGSGVNYAAYFLIGSFCSDGDIHVAHMAVCPLPTCAADAAGDALSKTLDDEWIADNAEKVTRILPGGIHIVGLAWFSERSTYNLQKAMLTRALARIQRTTNLLTTLNISSVSDQMALVYIEPPAGKPTGLVVDVVRRGPDSPTKVSFTALDWVSVVSNASARVTLNVPTRQKQSHFFTEFIASMKPFAENLLNCPLMSNETPGQHYTQMVLSQAPSCPYWEELYSPALRPNAHQNNFAAGVNVFDQTKHLVKRLRDFCGIASPELTHSPLKVLINGEIRDESEQLFKDVKKRKADSIDVQIFVDTTENKENTCEALIATNLHEVSFDIEIRAAVPAKSNVGSAVTAVKHHLIRNLTARAELQYESMDVIEEVSAAPCSVHQMPRPATTVLHTHPAILLSDYLFEADTVEDAQKNFDELLGLKTSIEHIDEGWERSLEIEEMETVRAPLDDTPIANYRSKEDDVGSIFTLLIALAVIVAVVGVVVYFVMGK